MHREADHSCFHSLQERSRKKQIRQVSENAEKRITRKKVEDNAISGRRGKISSTKNGVLDSITKNWTLKHIPVKGQIVVKTCQRGKLTYIKYQDIETEVVGQMQKWQSTKTHRNDCEQSRERSTAKGRR